jgi:hypothetical protein
MKNLLAVAAVLVAAQVASAAILAEYNFDDNDGVVDNTAPDVSATDLTNTEGSGWSFDGSADSDAEAGEAYSKINSGAWEFELSAAGAQVLDLTQMSFTVQAERWGNGRTHDYQVVLIDELDNETPIAFDAYIPDDSDPANLVLDDVTVAGVGQQGSLGGVGGVDNDAMIVVDLTGLANAASLKFGIRTDRAGGLTPESSLDNLVIEGAVVPEPATMSLLALGGLAVLRRRRR